MEKLSYHKNLSQNIYFLGIDGGGTKTTALLKDTNGKYYQIFESGPSNPRNVGIETSALNIAKAMKEVTKGIRDKIAVTFIGLAGAEEEYKNKKEKIKKAILKNLGEKKRVFDKIIIESDQLIAFKSGTNENDGIVVIAGTGSVARGWLLKKDIKSGGWGWLADEGSACWTGQQAYQVMLKSLDKRSGSSLLPKMIFNHFKIKTIEEFNEILYKDKITDILAFLSFFVDNAAKKKDPLAIKILHEGAKELANATHTVYRELKFKKKFPMVLVGGMFKSEKYFETFKKTIKNYKINTEIILPSKPPVYGGVKLAEEIYEEKS